MEKSKEIINPVRKRNLDAIKQNLNSILSHMRGYTFTDNEMKDVKPLIQDINFYATVTVDYHKREDKKRKIKEILK